MHKPFKSHPAVNASHSTSVTYAAATILSFTNCTQQEWDFLAAGQPSIVIVRKDRHVQSKYGWESNTYYTAENPAVTTRLLKILGLSAEGLDTWPSVLTGKPLDFQPRISQEAH